MTTLPSEIIAILLPFATVFYQHRVFQKAITLFIGSILCIGGVTVCAALRALGLNTDPAFSRFHRLLNRDRWNMLLASQILLKLLVEAFCRTTLTFSIDDTIERRRGKKIKAKGIFKDPLGTGSGKTVTCSGLRWVPIMILVRVPFMTRTVALPFMVILSPSEKTSKKMDYRHKSPQRLAEQVCFVLRRWFPGHLIVLVTDAGYTTKGLFRVCKKLKIQLIARAKSNLRFFELAPPRTGKRGRPRIKGNRLPSLKVMKDSPHIKWEQAVVEGYGGLNRECLIATRTCLWDPSEGGGPIQVQLVFVKNLNETDESTVFCLITIAPHLSLEEIVDGYAKRWSQEVTHKETREYLGMESQRQWSDLAIERTTPLLFACYSLIFLIANQLYNKISPAQFAWYQKQGLTFSDLLSFVRRMIRENQLSQVWSQHPILKNIHYPPELLQVFQGIGLAA